VILRSSPVVSPARRIPFRPPAHANWPARHIPSVVAWVAALVVILVAGPGGQQPAWCEDPSEAAAKPIDSSLSWRDAFLPPGIPSVALRYDETAVLWNPAGLAMSDAYFIGYSWKGTYLDDKRQVATHFLLVKSKGFGMGFTRDDYSEGTKFTTLFTLAPHVTKSSAVGFTGKWKGGFNFDCGAIWRFRNRVSLAAVGRNLRDRPTARRYIEGGLAVTALPGKLGVFFDVINEESPWRDALGYGGGLTARLERSVGASVSYFTDGDDHGTVRASLSFTSGVNLIEGEYSSSSDSWTTLSGRIASVGR